MREWGMPQLEHKKQAELRLQAEFDKREGRMQGRMTKDAAVIEEQSSMLLHRLEEVGSLTRALDELHKRFQAEVDAKASLNQDQREEIAQLSARVARAEHRVEEYKAQMLNSKGGTGSQTPAVGLPLRCASLGWVGSLRRIFVGVNVRLVHGRRLVLRVRVAWRSQSTCCSRDSRTRPYCGSERS